MRKRLASAALALLLCLSLLPTAAWAAETAFRDVSGHWAEETITAWQEKGDISGYSDGTFRPNDSVTRAEFVKLLNRALGLTAEGTISFTDVKESDWFYAEVAKAVAAGYASGMGDGMFQPEAPITRAQAAAMLARARSLTADESRADRFSDASAIPAWAKGSVGAVAASGYMTGYPDGSFGANGSITRAEAVVTLDRAQKSAQDVTIETAGTVLKDQTVTGDLLIAASVGEGNVTLQNVTVQGNLIIRGGGPNSVYLDGVTVQGEVRLEKDNLHVHLQGGTKLGKVVVSAKVKLSGSGTIDSLIVSASGVTLDRNLTVRKTETTGGAKAPTVYNPSSSSSSSGSSGGTKSRVITGVAPIAPITVNYGTSQENALPNTVTLNCEGGSTVEAAVTWTLDKPYNATPQTETTYTATGTVTIPAGYTYSGDTLTATVTITVWGSNQTISSIVAPTGIEVETGKLNDVDAAIAALPNRVVLKNGKGETIQVNGVVLTAPVTWKCIGGTIYSDKLSGMTAIQNFKGTLDTNDTRCVNSFIGTVTLPEGYKFTSNTPAWITTTITVKKAGEATSKSISGAVIADIAQKLDYASTNKVVEVLKNKKLLPTKLILQYNGEFMAEVDIPNDTNWTARRDVSSDNQLKYTLQPTLQASNIAVPVGYNIDQAILNNASCSVYVKALDTSKLETAIAEAEKQTENVLAYANTELGNITDLDKIYVISDGSSNPSKLDAETIKSEIPKGVRFVVDNTDMYSAFGTKLNEAKTKLRQSPDDAFNDQAACDTLAQGLTEATAALRALLANPTTGTKVNDAYVVGLVKKWLDNQSNAPWSEGVVMKPGGNRYSLRKSNTFSIENEDGTSTSIYVGLEWNFNKTYLQEDSNEGNLVLTNTTPETPQEVTFTATLTGYTIDNGNMVTVTNGTVGDYKVKVGAPVSADPGKIGEVTIPKLISGQTNENFTVQIPLRNEELKIENIAANSNITVTCTDDSLTNFTSININPPKDMQTDAPGFSFLEVYMTATAKQLSAVVASDTPAEGTDYEKTTVTFTIPSNAITLTTEAEEAGWYIPKNGLELTGNVEIWHPLVEITAAKIEGIINQEVKVTFNAKYWNSSYRPTVYMALVPRSGITITGNLAPQGNRVITGGEGTYDLSIPASGLTANTEYTVWVKVGDGDWTQSRTTYTHHSGQ